MNNEFVSNKLDELELLLLNHIWIEMLENIDDGIIILTARVFTRGN